MKCDVHVMFTKLYIVRKVLYCTCNVCKGIYYEEGIILYM